MMTREPATHAPGVQYSEDDQAMIASMLDGAEPDTYVVARLDDLVWQVQAAVQDEIRRRRDQQVRPARVAYRVSRVLQELGLLHDTHRGGGTAIVVDRQSSR